MGACIAWRDWVCKSGTISLVHTGSGTPTVSSTLPLTNLADRRLAKVCRITSTGTSVGGGQFSHGVNTIKWTAPASEDGRCVLIGLLNHNIASLASSATPIRIRAWSDIAGTILIYDSGNISSSLFKYTVGASYGSQTPQHVFGIPSSRLGTRAVRVEIDITLGNIPFSFITMDLGRLFIADGINLTEGIEGTWRTRVIDPSVVRRSRSQQVYSDDQLVSRSMDFGVDITSDQQAFDLDPTNRTDLGIPSGAEGPPSWAACAVEAGIHGEVVVIPDTALTTCYARYSAIYGTFQSPLEIEHRAASNYHVSGTIIEAR